MTDAAPLSNVQEYSVSELSLKLKRVVEEEFGQVRLRGEISGYRGAHGSGHAYFSLKDADAKIDAVIWRGTFGRLRVKPEEGMEVVATGRLTTYPGKSAYQIVIDSLELAGLGALMKLLEDRRRRLAAEGLFDEARKKPLPFLPEVIGVITSPTGAVIRDVLHRLAARFPRRVLVWPVAVQGEKAADEVAAAIAGFNALTSGGALPRPDVLIVARGGGSVEDLLAFSEESVVRAAAASVIPLISAVGHETDTTLIDYAADRRAPTPTAAAEMAVPVRAELIASAASLGSRMAQSAARQTAELRRRVRDVSRGLARPEDVLQLARQRCDGASARLAAALGQARERLAARLAQAASGLRPTVLRAETRRLTGLAGDLTRRLGVAVRRGTEERQGRLGTAGMLLEALSYRATLARGFAVVRGADGVLRRQAAAIQPGEALKVSFADGEVQVTVGGTGSAPARKPRGGGRGQGELF